MGLHLLRFWRRRFRCGGAKRVNPLLLTGLLGVLLTCSGIGLLELRLRPVVESLAVVQVQNRVTREINTALSEVGTDYHSIVSLQYDQQGNVLALTTDMGEVNRLRNQVAERVLTTISGMDVHELGVPLGSLFDVDLAWAKGPAIRVHSLVAGTVQTQIQSEFTAVGINQTRHRILLDITVPLTVLLPGISTQTEVTAQVCAAETIIVGHVPQTVVELPHTSGTEG